MPIERTIVMLVLVTLDNLRRHWLLFILPLIIGLPIAVAILKLTPTRYEAKSTILMIAANRGPDWAGGAAGFPRGSALEQVAVLEAWLKSDHVLNELLPQLLEGPVPQDPAVRGALTNVLRSALTLELTGSSVLEIKLSGPEAQGLGRKLEIVLTRLLEGVLNPEAGILSATQMIMARRAEAVLETDASLTRAIAAAGLGDLEGTKARLLALANLKRSGASAASMLPSGVVAPTADNPQPARSEGAGDAAVSAHEQQLEDARAAISKDPEVVRRLERLYANFEEARTTYQQSQARSNSAPSSYVRVFDAPERLTVIGRPRDPLTGTNPGRKFAIAVMMLAFLVSLGLMALYMLFDKRLRIDEDFDVASDGIPVLGRLPALRRAP